MTNSGTFKKGEIRPNQGKRGPSKTTKLAREALASLVDGNADKLQRWLDAIEKQNGPEAAFKCFMSLLEYHVPKLGRTELVAKDGKDLNMSPTLIINTK